MQLDLGLAPLGEPEAESHVLESGGEPPTSPHIVVCGRERCHRRERFRREHVALHLRSLRAGVDDVADGDAFGHDRLSQPEAALDERVLPTDLDRIHTERLSELVHLHLGDEGTLWATKAAERSAGHRVGVDRCAVDVRVGNLVGTSHAEVSVAQHLVRRVVVGASVEEHLGLDGGDRAVRGGAELRMDCGSVTFVVTDDRFLTRPGAMHRPVDAERMHLAGGEREHDLEAHVLFAAERSTDGRVDDANLSWVNVERVGDLLLVFPRPLAAGFDSDDSVLDPCGCRFGLEECVLLMWEFVGSLDHHFGVGPPRSHVTLADLQLVIAVAGELAVNEGVVGTSLGDVLDDRQRLPLDVEQCRRVTRLFVAFGHDDRHVVGFPPADRRIDCAHSAVFQAEQNRLVKHREAVLVDRDVGGGHDRDHSRRRLSSARAHRDHAGMGLTREHGYCEQRISGNIVAPIASSARDLVVGVEAAGRCSDAHEPAPLRCVEAALRTAWVIG